MHNVLLAFQQSRGVCADGIIRDGTLRPLRGAPYTLDTRVLSYDPLSQMTGEDVGVLQVTSQELGFHDARVDNHFDPETDASVCEYQLNYELEPSGICGPATLRALNYSGKRATDDSVNTSHERGILRAMGLELSGKRIVVDPGLGAEELGTVVDDLYGQVSEEEIPQDLTSCIEGHLVAAGAETILSRPRTDSPFIESQAEMTNTFGVDIFISLQADHYHNNRVNGIATFYFGSMRDPNSILGEQFSGLIQREIVAHTSLVDCCPHAHTWNLLRLTRTPMMEVAVGYLINEGDVAILSSPDQQGVVAEPTAIAIKRLYLGGEEQQPITGTYSLAQLIEKEKA